MENFQYRLVTTQTTRIFTRHLPSDPKKLEQYDGSTWKTLKTYASLGEPQVIEDWDPKIIQCKACNNQGKMLYVHGTPKCPCTDNPFSTYTKFK